MLYYIVLYFVRKFAEKKPLIPFVLCIGMIIVWYLFEDSSSLFMYGYTYFKWVHYFLFMLFGAYIGNKTINLNMKPIVAVVLLLLSVITFYGIQMLAVANETLAHLQIFSLIPLMGVVTCIYRLCSVSCVDVMMRSKFGLCIRFVSGLCLEIYIVHSVVIRYMEGMFTAIFPFNLPITFLEIVVSAYLTRCLGRIVSQLFEKEEFDWKAVVKAV